MCIHIYMYFFEYWKIVYKTILHIHIESHNIKLHFGDYKELVLLPLCQNDQRAPLYVSMCQNLPACRS